jgi:formiminotetrahydrofolate cyclodeaminase
MDIPETTIRAFLQAASSATPTPGGGCIAGVGGAVGSSMALMAANFTTGKKKFRDVEPEVKELIAKLEALQADFLRFARSDMDAYSALNAAFKMPRESDDEKKARKQAIADGALEAVRPPDSILDGALEALRGSSRLAVIANPNLKSDVGVACWFLHAAAHAAADNVRINLPLMPKDRAGEYEQAVASRLDEADALHRQILDAISR